MSLAIDWPLIDLGREVISAYHIRKVGPIFAASCLMIKSGDQYLGTGVFFRIDVANASEPVYAGAQILDWPTQGGVDPNAHFEMERLRILPLVEDMRKRILEAFAKLGPVKDVA